MDVVKVRARVCLAGGLCSEGVAGKSEGSERQLTVPSELNDQAECAGH